MTRKSAHSARWYIFPIALVAIAVTGLVMGLLSVGGVSIQPDRMYEKLLIPLIRLLCYLTVGLLIGQVVETMGWTARLARAVSPVTRWGHLKSESGAAFLSSFVSGIVANTMLMSFYDRGTLTRKELILSYLANNGVPIYTVHLPTTFFIVFSLAKGAGLTYLAITFCAACLRTLGALVYARVTLPNPGREELPAHDQPRSVKQKPFSSVLIRFRDRLIRTVLFTVPIYTLVFLINEWGAFVWLRKTVTHWVAIEFFPIEAASVIIFSVVAEFSSGFAAAGALLDAGTLTVKQAAVALIAGTIVAAPMRAVRHQLPTHSGIFTLALGSQLLLLSQGLRILSLIIVTIPYVLWM